MCLRQLVRVGVGEGRARRSLREVPPVLHRQAAPPRRQGRVERFNKRYGKKAGSPRRSRRLAGGQNDPDPRAAPPDPQRAGSHHAPAGSRNAPVGSHHAPAGSVVDTPRRPRAADATAFEAGPGRRGQHVQRQSEETIRRIKRALIARRAVQVFKPAIDDRYGGGRALATATRSSRARPPERDFSPRCFPKRPSSASTRCSSSTPASWRFAHARRGRAAGDLCGLDRLPRRTSASAGARWPSGSKPSDLRRLRRAGDACPADRERHPRRPDDPVIVIGAQEAYEARCRTCHEVPRRARS